MHRQFSNYSFALLLIGVVCGCNTLSKERYASWVVDYDHGLHVQKQVGNFIFDIQYKPWELLWIERSERNPEDINKVKEELSGLQYFTLTIRPVQGTEARITDEQLYYYSYRFHNDITLEENGQTLQCVLFHFENGIDGMSGSTFSLGFETQGSPDEVTVTINSPLFGQSPIRLVIEKQEIPQLSI